MKILVACEESQAITKELRKLGHEAYSCDLLECSGGRPDWHFKCDVFEVIKNNGGLLQNGKIVKGQKKWEMMIAHPPCTYLAVSGARWFYHPDDAHLPITDRRPHPNYKTRAKDREDAIKFVKKLFNAPIDKIAIENPIGTLSTRFKRPDQIVHPYMFGDSASKATCLWLKGLPLLKPTKIVDKGERITFKSGKSQPKWYSDAFVKAKTAEERRTLRSKTFQGMASAMAKQWTKNTK
jgi:hypothetical protein